MTHPTVRAASNRYRVIGMRVAGAVAAPEDTQLAD
jgi:hypothetical protein